MPLPDPGPDAGVDTSATFGSIGPDETGQICDWYAGRLGAYGARRSCGAVNFTVPASKSGCVSDLGMATACSVGEFEQCIDAVVAGPCTSGAIPAGCLDFTGCALESSTM